MKFKSYMNHAMNAFSPNGDGVNDIILPLVNCNFTQYNLKIFNRQSEKVFESDDANEAWDGTFKNKNALVNVYGYLL